MIVVAGSARVPLHRRDEAVDLLKRMIAQTRQEPGCLSTGYYESIEAPATFFLFQEWDSEEALHNHYRQAFVREFLARLPEMLDGTTAVQFLNRYDVAETMPL